MIQSLRRFFTDFAESVRIAAEQLRAHKFRSLLTALGVIIGVWAVISIGIAINGLNRGFSKSLDMLGSDLFYVEKWPWRDIGDDWHLYRNRPGIRTESADRLNEIIAQTPNSTLLTAVPVTGIQRSISHRDIRAGGVSINGTTADFTYIHTGELASGRFFTPSEALSGQNVVVIGSSVAENLFPGPAEEALDSRVRISNRNYTVIGVMAPQGSFLGMMSFDNQAFMPLRSLHKIYSGRGWWGSNNSIRVLKKPGIASDVARDEIIGAMRLIRGLEPGEDNDFEVNSSEAIEDTLGPIKAGIALAGFAITGLALFVGAIGIMNITFVSVKERTREIGTRRAIGARRSSILSQFLLEAVAVCLLGGAVGLATAFATQLAVSHFVPTFPGTVSLGLILMAVAISIITGVLSGFVPALMASRLDPATALRHE